MDGLDIVQLNIVWQVWHDARVVRLALFHQFIGDSFQGALDTVDELMQNTDRRGMFADLASYSVIPIQILDRLGKNGRTKMLWMRQPMVNEDLLSVER